ncbi:MAG: hypothetical protein R2788_06605 [Saprospiraceae bacterium]
MRAEGYFKFLSSVCTTCYRGIVPDASGRCPFETFEEHLEASSGQAVG